MCQRQEEGGGGKKAQNGIRVKLWVLLFLKALKNIFSSITTFNSNNTEKRIGKYKKVSIWKLQQLFLAIGFH